MTVNDSSGLEVAKRHIETFSLVIYCLITVAGTLGNGLVIYVTGFKMKRTVNSVWFLNLAIADFLFTTFLIFTTVSLHWDEWPFGNFMCKLSSLVNVINMFASVFLLMAISVDRCLSIWVVVWAQNKRTVCKAQIICAVIWVTAGICSTPYATFRTVEQFSSYEYDDYVYDSNISMKSYCIYPSTMASESHFSLIIFRFVMGFLIPFLVILVSYVAIAIRARHLQRTRRRRSHWIIVAVILTFFICWLPFHILSFIESNAKQDLQVIVIVGGPLTVSLAYMNSCLNPILYVFMCDEFQKKIKQSICLVLESALAEDRMSFASSRSLSSWVPRKSSTVVAFEGKDANTSTESKAVYTERTQSMEENMNK
ncbi:C3a anaphylatoxin chemotactic receptor-like [Nematolebias whitei]|uniref:C3a anaphylatoxin chemotactic receptor-like n=1 Tax=Nematolebias whitei TaxID=451745 RepID=UPI001898E947|nr:C3a anaphylatoxin chemotactic receptor-like [Nematolebias whitei]